MTSSVNTTFASIPAYTSSVCTRSVRWNMVDSVIARERIIVVETEGVSFLIPCLELSIRVVDVPSVLEVVT